MWKFLAQSITSKKGRAVAISAWVIVPIGLLAASISGITPSLTEISSNSQANFLPVGAESTEAINFQKEYFPTNGTPGILVYRRSSGLSNADMSKIRDDYQWLQRRAEGSSILGEVAGIFDNPDLEPTALSEDGSTLLIFFSLLGTGDVPVEEVQKEVRSIRSELVKPGDTGLEVWLTGTVGVLEDAVSVFQSIDLRITMISVLLVLIILLAIYRFAIILAVLPILSAGLAYLAASNIVALLAESTGLPVTAQATSIMVVLIFGAGTDYMLFISSRFREQLQIGKSVPEGIAETMTKVGPAIFSSAATTILAMVALSLATLRSYQVLGPILALGMVFAIVAGLTFVPAALSLFGRAAYWPYRIRVVTEKPEDDSPSAARTGGFWNYIASWIGKRPLFTVLASIILLLVMSTGILRLEPSYDLRAGLPENTESVQGFNVMESSFPAGTVSPTSVYVMTERDPLKTFAELNRLTEDLSSVDGVDEVTSPTQPFGIQVGGSPKEYAMAIRSLPEETRSALSNLGMMAMPDLLSNGTITPDQARSVASIASTYSHISRNGNAIRMEVIFEGDPGSSESLAKIADLRRVAAKYVDADFTKVLVGGDTAIQYDTKTATIRDMKVIAPIVLAIIFIILVFLVRAFTAPLYLLGSVLLSFFGSLGISVLFFRYVLEHEGIGSGVPIFMFIFIVALGVDYNIYIITRVQEESRRLGIKDGTIAAVSRTGGVITSAGIILAGTFASLTTLPLREVFQLGFVVAFGVLLDTLFVRGVMVPAFVMLLGKWNWWPSKSAMNRAK